MLLEAISFYLKEVETTLGETEDAYIELYEEEILASGRVTKESIIEKTSSSEKLS